MNELTINKNDFFPAGTVISVAWLKFEECHSNAVGIWLKGAGDS